MAGSFSPIFVKGTTVSLQDFEAYGEEGELVTLAVVSFGFLLIKPDLQARLYSFDELANAIEARYSLDSPRTAAIVAALREVGMLKS